MKSTLSIIWKSCRGLSSMYSRYFVSISGGEESGANTIKRQGPSVLVVQT